MNLAGRLKVMFIAVLIVLTAIFGFGCAAKQTAKPQATTGQQLSPHASSSQQETPKDVGPPTYVAKGMTPTQHVEKYYQAYKDQKWEEAYNLQPAVSKAREDLEAYIESHKEMPLTTFSVSAPKEDTKDTASVEAVLGLGGSGGGMQWMTVWSFKKDGARWIAEQTQSGIKQ